MAFDLDTAEAIASIKVLTFRGSVDSAAYMVIAVQVLNQGFVGALRSIIWELNLAEILSKVKVVMQGEACLEAAG